MSKKVFKNQGDPRDPNNVWAWKEKEEAQEFGLGDLWQICSMGTGAVSLLWKRVTIAWLAVIFTIAAFTTQKFTKRDLRTLTMSFAFSVSTLFMLHYREPGSELPVI